MILEFKINEKDFLEFQLFTASKSERIHKKKIKGWVLLTIGSVVVAINFFLKDNIPMTVYFGLVAIACGFFYPNYFKWRYKKHYKTFIKENYSKRFGEVEILEIHKDSIVSKDKIGESKINISEIEQIDETDNHFFLKISTGVSLLIPKNEIGEVNVLRKKFKELGLIVNNNLGWEWK